MTLTEKIEQNVKLTMMDCERCFASKTLWGGTVIDVINPLTGRTWIYGHTLEEVRAEHPDAEEMSLDEFGNWKASQQNTAIQWEPTTEDKFNEMLDVLPPAYYSGRGFLVGEPYDHHATTGRPRYQAYKFDGESYWASNRPLTILEFKTEMGVSQ